MDISIFGLGYVGCVSIGCLAANSHKIIGVDINKHKVDLINKGKPTIIEAGIDELIATGSKKGLISATNDARQAILDTDISFICSGTPSSPTGHLNLNSIYHIATNISRGIKEKDRFHIVVIRSTVMPGTNRKVAEIIQKESGKKRNEDFAVVSNPEFLREGSAVADYNNPAVTVLGSDSPKALKTMNDLYSFIDTTIIETSIEVAEIIKYINNSFHALKITFANEVGNICKSLKIDSHEVMRVFGTDNKLNISTAYFKPGFAYGGSCLPKDLQGLGTIAHDAYLKTPLLSSIHESNEYQKEIAFHLVTKYNKRSIGVLGLSFKKGTDDLRYSPAVDLVEKLIGKGYTVSIYDKNVNLSNITGTNKAYIDEHLPHLSSLITDDLKKVIHENEVLVITYREHEFENLIANYPEKIFVDLAKVTEDTTLINYEGICW
ncbi:MAG: UDP-glucose/GDP-mannose dehydrogenase family protein [Bacteroidales bacterium]|nr:UDP-glucose/GDP-mannose dehydrogenase family protein [Bacteroidales bacterium]